MKPKVLPYYYPTSIILLDDNKLFLDTLSLYLSQFFNCNAFVDAPEALYYANKTTNLKSRENPIVTLRKEDKNKDFFRHIKSKQNEKNRSDDLSVVVVDYDMPNLNGVDFCSQLQDSSISKVLLTGRATHKQVVKAFNNNIIDYYIEKQDDNLLSTVRDIVRDMQKSYFQRRLQTMTLSFVESGATYFLDTAAANFFDDLYNKVGATEHFFMESPSRFAINCNGRQNLLLVLTEADLLEHITILKEEQGPEEWINALSEKKYVPYFNSSDGFYDPDCPNVNFPLHKAMIVEGQQVYYFALIEGVVQSMPSKPIFHSPSDLLH